MNLFFLGCSHQQRVRGVQGREGIGEMGVLRFYYRILLCMQLGILGFQLNLFGAEPGGIGSPTDPVSTGRTDPYRTDIDPYDPYRDLHEGKLPPEIKPPKLPNPLHPNSPDTGTTVSGHTGTIVFKPSGPIVPDPHDPPIDPVHEGGQGNIIIDQPPLVITKKPPISDQITSLSEVLEQAHVDRILQSTQSFVSKLYSAHDQVQAKVFLLKVKVADALANGFYSPARVWEIENLITDLVTQQSSLEATFKAIKDSITAINQAYQQTSAAQGSLTASVTLLLSQEQEALASLKTIIQIVRQEYESLAYTLVSLQQDILNDEFMHRIAEGSFDPKKDYKWFEPVEKKGVITQVDQISNFLGSMEAAVQKVVVAEEVEDELECFFLAKKVGKLKGQLQQLQQAFEMYKNKKIAENSSFEDALATVIESLEKIGEEHSALANCPFAAQQKYALDHAIENLKEDVAMESVKKE